MGKFLLAMGLSLALVGLALLLWDKGGWRIPGDLVLRGRRWTLYLPLGTSLLLSALLTFFFWLFSRR
jgi:membrane protease YdiL (CAAX protease family)